MGGRSSKNNGSDSLPTAENITKNAMQSQAGGYGVNGHVGGYATTSMFAPPGQIAPMPFGSFGGFVGPQVWPGPFGGSVGPQVGPGPGFCDPVANPVAILANQLSKFYKRYAPGRYKKVDFIAMMYVNDRPALDRELLRQYGKTLSDIEDGSELAGEVSELEIQLAKFYARFAPGRYKKVDFIAMMYVNDRPALDRELLRQYGKTLSDIKDERQDLDDGSFSEERKQDFDAMISVNKCACCDFPVEEKDKQFYDGRFYYHLTCWEQLVVEIQHAKQSMFDEQMQKKQESNKNAFEGGLSEKSTLNTNANRLPQLSSLQAKQMDTIAESD